MLTKSKNDMKTFYHLLINNTFAGIINFTVWFAITFFVFLETKSVFATSIIAGLYLVLTAVSGFWFGSLVDRFKKKQAMLISSIASLIIYGVCFAIYQTAGPTAFKNPSSITLWIFVSLIMIGVIIGNIRNIALPTVVTMLFTAEKRDKANGLVGTSSGVGFLVTSVISGFLVGISGMFHVLLLAILVTSIAIVHLLTISFVEKTVSDPEEHNQNKIDIKGTINVISKIPGLFPLIIFSVINNFLGGVFMSLMDAYGLSLVSVQTWGLLWGLLSTAFIVGGLVVAKLGLGKNPLRTVFLGNIVIWTISIFFTIQPWIALLASGMYIYLLTIPFIEASEQTIIQKVVPVARQGRVFGFSQSVEQAASPLTAFFIGPLTQFIFIPFMTTGSGVQLIGSWYGTGADRGIALVFTVTGIIGLCVTLLAMSTKYYRELSNAYLTKK